MHFVTSKRAGYVLFCMTPSGRGQLAVPEPEPEPNPFLEFLPTTSSSTR